MSEGAYDVVVVGLGGMGSATLAHVAKRGRRVLGIERFARGHEFGASSGRSRIIRKAYFEDPAYVPLLVRAYELWRELERETGATLLDLRGLLVVGDAGGRVVRGILASADEHGLAIDRLDRADVLARYPSLLVERDECGLFERDAGSIDPEASVDAHLNVAEAAGAVARFSTRVAGIASRPDGIAVALDDGTTVLAARLAVCAGPWTSDVLPDLALPIRLQRNVQVWFRPTVDAYAAGRFPAFLVDRPARWPAPLYGFADAGHGVKAAFHGFGETTSADGLERGVSAGDVAAVADALETWMPGAAGELIASKACTYALTPDEHFAIDVLPGDDRIAIAGGFSGHGFKFCSVVGEIVADLALEGGTRHAIGFLRLARLLEAGPSPLPFAPSS
ncbi:MAG: N-methyl-L-tryptophan oxidase [Candidatus Eremiobacteraeota bacterium]|nr:N-methyl-L-tryptophan oxidase [Candidatus Eremiobacteraeota bacterium]